jgi:ectoine hydroxylase-related dioxygenase (phytanoyl-CoA dioxygenase family)
MGTQVTPELSASEIEFYQEHGWWLSPGPVLPPEEIAAARDAVESLYREGIPEHVPTAHKAHLNWRPGDGDTMRVNNYAATLHPALRALACHPVIGAIAAQLADTASIRLFNSSLVYKPAGDLAQTNSVGWHTDKAYWSTCTSSQMLTAWIPLHEVTADRSPLTVLDRSHRWPAAEVGDLQRVRGFTAAQRNLMEDALCARSVDYQPVVLTMPVGSVSFHHCLTFHGSAPNASDQPRVSLTVHLQDDSNRWRPALETDGSPVRYQHDDKVRRGPDGNPDYADPSLCPLVWPGDDLDAR